MLQKHHIDNIENILEVLILAIYFGSLLPRKQWNHDGLLLWFLKNSDIPLWTATSLPGRDHQGFIAH